MSAGSLILGVGNPTRGDDAAGWVLADRLAALRLPGVEVQKVQQLTPEWAPRWLEFGRVLVLDAACAGPEVAIAGVGELGGAGGGLSHDCDPALLCLLAERLYGVRPRVYVCTVRAEGFELGVGLSASVERRLEEAFQQVRSWL